MKQIKVSSPIRLRNIAIFTFLLIVCSIMLLYFGYRNIKFSQIHFPVTPAVYSNGLNSSKLYKMKPRSIFTFSEMLHDENWEIREQAAYTLGKTKDYRALEPLIAALKDKDPGVRWTAAWALGEIGDKRAFEPLLSACTDPDNEMNPELESWFMRDAISTMKTEAKHSGDTFSYSIFTGVDIQREAIKSLLKIDQKEAKKRLIPLIEKEKRAGVLAAMEMNDCSYLGDLLKLLEIIGFADASESWNLIMDVRMALQRMACPDLINTFLFGKLYGYEERVIHHAVMGMDQDIVLDAALPALWNKDSRIRKRALLLIDSFWDARVKADLIRLLDDETVREATISMLCQREDPSLKHVFIEKLNDRNQAVRAYAAQALLRLGDLRAVESIMPNPERKSYCYDEYFMNWLGKAGNEKARQILLSILKKWSMNGSQHYTLGHYAALKLGELKERMAIPLLSSILHDGRDQKKDAVMVALGQLKVAQAVPAILKELKNSFSNGPNNGYTQYYALQALQNISSSTAAAPLAKIYESGPHWQNYSHAINILDTFEKCFSGEFIPILQKQLRNSNLSIRVRVVEILGKSRNVKAIAALRPLLNDVDWLVRKAALDSLWANSSLTKQKLLQFILNEPHWPTKFAAIALLRQFHVEPAEIDALRCKRNEPFLIRQQLLSLEKEKSPKMHQDDSAKGSLPLFHLPFLMVLNEKGVSQMAYDSVKNEYKVSHFSEHTGYSQMVQSKNFLFVTNNHSIARFDQNLNPGKSVELGKIGACVSDRELLYVSANGYFMILDENLSIISSLPLGIFSAHSGKRKNAHDIAIHENVAYLIDNVVAPIYTLKINVTDPKRPRIAQETEIDYVNQHLDAQWVVPDQNEWWVIQNSKSMGGFFQRNLKFSLISGKLKDSVLLFRDIENTNSWRRIDGWLEAVDHLSPEWMVIRRDDEYFLGRLSMDTGELLEQGLLSLGVYADSESRWEKHWKMRCNRDLVFIFNDFQLWVVHIGKKTEILVFQKFGEKILDMVFFGTK